MGLPRFRVVNAETKLLDSGSKLHKFTFRRSSADEEQDYTVELPQGEIYVRTESDQVAAALAVGGEYTVAVTPVE